MISKKVDVVVKRGNVRKLFKEISREEGRAARIASYRAKKALEEAAVAYLAPATGAGEPSAAPEPTPLLAPLLPPLVDAPAAAPAADPTPVSGEK